MRLIPGPKRLNLHAIYLESDTPVSRDQIKPEHFKNWVEWAKANQLGLDFNPSCFSHPAKSPMALHFPMPTTAFASSGLTTVKPAAVFQPILVSNSAHRR